MTMQLKKVRDGAILPTRASHGAAGYDLYACINESVVIPPGATFKTPTGIALYMGNSMYCGLILPRSGLGSSGIVLANTVGLIDSDYQGELIVALHNRSNEAFTVHKDMRIAQLLILPVRNPTFKIVDEFDKATSRNMGGFGSTGT